MALREIFDGSAPNELCPDVRMTRIEFSFLRVFCVKVLDKEEDYFSLKVQFMHHTSNS